MSGTSLVCIEFIVMMTAIDRLSEAARSLGHLDATGLLDVEGPGFRMLVVEAAEKVAADQGASAVRADAARQPCAERQALTDIRDVLDELIDQ